MKWPLFLLMTGLLFIAGPQMAEARDNGFNRPHGNHDGNCRAYTRQIVQHGRWETAYGTACLYRDGVWRIVAENVGRPAMQAPYYGREAYPAYYPNRNQGYYVHKRDGRHDRYGRNDILYRGPDRNR